MLSVSKRDDKQSFFIFISLSFILCKTLFTAFYKAVFMPNDYAITINNNSGFEGGVRVLTVPVPGHCILVTLLEL